MPGVIVEGRREFDFTEITPGIVPMTKDLSAFARQLKATLGEEEKNKIRSIIKNIDSFTYGLDSLIQNYQNIITEVDKNNIHNILENFNKISTSLNKTIDKEFNKLSSILNNIEQITNESDEFILTIKEFKISSLSVSNLANKLNKLLDEVDKGNGTIAKLINNSELHDNMNDFIDDLSSLVKDIENNPIKYM